MDKIHTERDLGEYFCLTLHISEQIIEARHCQSEKNTIQCIYV